MLRCAVPVQPGVRNCGSGIYFLLVFIATGSSPAQHDSSDFGQVVIVSNCGLEKGIEVRSKL